MFKRITELWLVDAILSGDHFQNCNGKLTSKEEKKKSIIFYSHSW